MTITLNGTTGITSTGITETSDGNVGIGTSSPVAKLQVYGANVSGVGQFRVDSPDVSQITFAISNANQANWYSDGSQTVFGTSTATPLVLRTNSTERARITSSGTLLLGTTTPIYNTTGAGNGFEFHPAGYLSTKRNATSGAGHILFHNPNGIVGSIQTINSSTNYLTSSDYRLKQDWQPMTGASERVKALKPVNFAWKVDGSRVDGFLAHEAQAVVPEAVTGEKDAVDAEGNPEYQGIDQSKLVPLLTAALQEALAEIETLKARVSALEAA